MSISFQWTLRFQLQLKERNQLYIAWMESSKYFKSSPTTFSSMISRSLLFCPHLDLSELLPPSFSAALWKWQPNTPNTSFSTSHLFGSPSPLLVPAMATSYQQRHTLHWFTSPTPNRHQPYTIPLSLLCDEAQLFHFLRILWRCLALEQGRLETWVLSGIW